MNRDRETNINTQRETEMHTQLDTTHIYMGVRRYIKKQIHSQIDRHPYPHTHMKKGRKTYRERQRPTQHQSII